LRRGNSERAEQTGGDERANSSDYETLPIARGHVPASSMLSWYDNARADVLQTREEEEKFPRWPED
jgi:hypothetical protein